MPKAAGGSVAVCETTSHRDKIVSCKSALRSPVNINADKDEVSGNMFARVKTGF